jgi:esterase/lipase superfamily enzyme
MLRFQGPHRTVITVLGLSIAVALGCGDGAGSDASVRGAMTGVSNGRASTIQISPSSATIEEGSLALFNCVALDSRGVVASSSGAWTISDPTVATVGANGAVTARHAGKLVASCSIDGKSATATINVTPRHVAFLEVAPRTVELTVGASTQLIAVARDAMGNVLVGRRVQWTIEDSAVATVSATGSVRAVAEHLASDVTTASEIQRRPTKTNGTSDSAADSQKPRRPFFSVGVAPDLAVADVVRPLPRRDERVTTVTATSEGISATAMIIALTDGAAPVVQSGTAGSSSPAAIADFASDVERVSKLHPPSINALVWPTDSVTIPVFYASTRRRDVKSDNAEEFYMNEPEPGQLHYGVGYVGIPAGDRVGNTDGRGWCRYLGPFRCRRSIRNGVTVIALDTLTEEAWVESLSSVVGGSNKCELLLLVHGFNTDFSGALRSAAQFSYDVGFRGVTAVFDWSSVHNIARYVVDQEEAERSLTLLKRFLDKLLLTTPSENVCILAHSMGTRLVAYALRDFANEHPRRRFGQVILAASDIDSSVFVNELAPKITTAAVNVTAYASKEDKALKLSSSYLVHAGRRVGSGPPSVVIHDGMDYVDASNVDTDLIGHGYYEENKLVIDDLFYILRHGLPASERWLAPVVLDGARVYFRFR